MKKIEKNKTYLITGAAGFIGYYLAKSLLEYGVRVVGFDNMNDYYEVSLKKSRLEILNEFKNFVFLKGDISNKEQVDQVFEKFHPEYVVNLAAQAGVRYSIDNPSAYMQSNIMGFFHILEACRYYPVEHLVFASSSSVYGESEKIPFSTEDPTEQPVSLYAATKKSNELMAHAYSKLYEIPVTGLRFFTVYGPMGRPDMAYFKFAKEIMAGKEIEIFNQGEMYRDFTYIDDIITGIENLLCKPPKKNDKGVAYRIYNIGNNRPEKLMDFISILEKCLGKEAKKVFLPMQKGDVPRTYADVDDLIRDFDFKPSTNIEQGLAAFAQWFKTYYG